MKGLGRFVPAIGITMALAVASTLIPSAAQAFIAGDGKGKPDRDCYIGLEGYSPEDLSPISKNGKKQGIACTDCDPECDLDGVPTADGSCTFRIGACINNTGVAGCDPSTRTPKNASAKAKSKAGKIDFGTSFPSDLSSACSSFVDFPVPVKGKKKNKPGKGKVTLVAKKKTDKDKFTFVCNPRPEGEACPAPTTTVTVTSTTTSTSTSTTTTTLPPCGNGTIDGDEECDPGAEPTGCNGGDVCVPLGANSCTCQPCVAPGPSDPASVQFTTGFGTDFCGGVGLTPPPDPPSGGELQLAGGTKFSDLGLGCLYIGAGQSTLAGGATPDSAPNIYDVDLVCPDGSLLLKGGAGTSDRDCSMGIDSGDRFCINGLPGTDDMGSCTTDDDCRPICQDPGGGTCEGGETCTCANGAGPCTADGGCGTGSTTLICVPRARCYFGPPLPIVNPQNSQLSTCVQNVFQVDGGGFADPTSGELNLTVPLSSRVYLTGTTFGAAQPCPACVAGTCDGGPSQGMPCTGVGAPGSTHDCLPFGYQYLAPLAVTLSPLSTGGGTLPADGSISPNGLFCPGQVTPGAFSETEVRKIVATGSPAAGGISTTPEAATISSAFCIPKTGNILIDGSANLPGPGQTSLAGEAVLLPAAP
jgi:hypothetical protein